MRKLLWLLLLVGSAANAQYYDKTLIPIADGIGTSGAAIPLLNGSNTWSGSQNFSGSTVTLPATSTTLANLATQAANTVVGNATSGSASPTALAVGGCSSASSALIWTTNTGFGCNTSITAAALTATAPPTVNSVSMSYVLAMWGIPVILPGGGTFSTTPSAASGLTLTTALPNTSACTSTTGCYMYFPLGAICTTCNGGGNSAAGVYFTQCASTTLCSVFNNILTSGAPTTQASPTSFGTISTNGAYTQTVGSSVNLVTISVPANSLGPNGGFIYEEHAARASNAGAIRVDATFGGTNVGFNNQVSVQSDVLRRYVNNLGTTGKQVAISGATTSPTDLVNINAAPTWPTIDTTSAQNLIFTGQLVTSSTDWLVITSGVVTINHAP